MSAMVITYRQYYDADVKQGKNQTKLYFIAPSHPRLINGVNTRNPRYLQKVVSVDTNTFDKHLREVGTRLSRKIPLDQPIYYPVNAVLPTHDINNALLLFILTKIQGLISQLDILAVRN